MALATRCPNCHALFRVVADQLKLRGGLVRCGACGHAFDAIGTLSYLDDASMRAVPAQDAAPEEGGSPLTLRIAPNQARGDGNFEPSEPPPQAPPDESGGIVAGAVPHAVPESAERSAVGSLGTPNDVATTAPGERAPREPEPAADRSDEDAEGEAVAAAGSSAPDSGESDGATATSAGFLLDEPEPRQRAAKLFYRAAAIVLALMLSLQALISLRAEIAAQWPATRPALVHLCQALRCNVGWPMRGEMLAVVGSELQSLPGTNALELTAVVRNRAAVTLALPALEVTLTDTQNRALARRIFAPVDYLAAKDAAARIAGGLEAGADLTVRITFEARGLSVAGFVVYPFYL
jgi:predicted Zn finger-like uncharacterized protein